MQPSAASDFGFAPGTSPPATGSRRHSPSGISTSSPAVPAEQATDLAGAKKREPSFLTIREAADVLRVSESTIRNAIGSGRLRAFRFGNRGGSIRIAGADLDDYIAGAATSPLVSRTPAPTGGQFKHLDASKLLAAWRRQGVLGKQQGKSPVPAPETNSF